METPFTKSETYIGEFNTKDFLETYYEKEKGVMTGELWLNFALKNLHETFTSGAVKGDLLIDIGAGPTIYHLLSACEVFKNIITSDFLQQNIAEQEKWLKKDPSAFNWSHIIKFVCELEGDSKNCERKEEKLRGAVKQILIGDALNKNPFEPHVLPPADCLLSCLCLEACCKDFETYCNVLKNFKDLLKPGGHLIIQSVLNSSYYFVGKKRFFPLTSTKESVEKAFKKAGYKIKNMVVSPLLNKTNSEFSDYDGHYFVLAQKPPTP